MAELLTSAQMRGIEADAMETGQVSGLTLMERAGQGVVAAICGARPETASSPGRAVVLAGPGNNGGDGYVIARLLQDLGWTVDVFALGDPDRLPPDALANANRWRQSRAVQPMDAAGGPAPDLLVDAVFRNRPDPRDPGDGLARFPARFADLQVSSSRSTVPRASTPIAGGGSGLTAPKTGRAPT